MRARACVAIAAVLGFNEQTAGTFVSGVFVTGATLLWTFSYVFRVVNKVRQRWRAGADS